MHIKTTMQSKIYLSEGVNDWSADAKERVVNFKAMHSSKKYGVEIGR